MAGDRRLGAQRQRLRDSYTTATAIAAAAAAAAAASAAPDQRAWMGGVSGQPAGRRGQPPRGDGTDAAVVPQYALRTRRGPRVPAVPGGVEAEARGLVGVIHGADDSDAQGLVREREESPLRRHQRHRPLPRSPLSSGPSRTMVLDLARWRAPWAHGGAAVKKSGLHEVRVGRWGATAEEASPGSRGRPRPLDSSSRWRRTQWRARRRSPRPGACISAPRQQC
jgi:hypothetical protein